MSEHIGKVFEIQKEKEKVKLPKWKVIYHDVTILIPYPRNPRTGECNSCHRDKSSGEIKVTQLHHTWYEFKLDTVKKNPLLALKNTLEVCFPCHNIADGFRNILDGTNMERIMSVVVKLPDFQLKKLTIFCKEFLKWYNENGTSHDEIKRKE